MKLIVLLAVATAAVMGTYVPKDCKLSKSVSWYIYYIYTYIPDND